MKTETFKAWLAGFFDGEGSVGLTQPPLGIWKVPRISLTQKGELELMILIRSEYGGSISQHSGNRDVNQWNLSKAADVIKFLEDVLPYLQLERKKQRALIVLGIAKLIVSGNFHSTYGTSFVKEEDQQSRANLEDEYAKLPQKGVQ